MNAIHHPVKHVLRHVELASLGGVVLAVLLLASLLRSTVHAESTLSDDDLFVRGSQAYDRGDLVDAAFYLRMITERHPGETIRDPDYDRNVRGVLAYLEHQLQLGLTCLYQCQTCVNQKVVEQQQRDPIPFPSLEIKILPVEALRVPPLKIRKPVGFESPSSTRPFGDWERSITTYNKLLPYLDVRPKLPEINIPPELDLNSMRRHQ